MKKVLRILGSCLAVLGGFSLAVSLLVAFLGLFGQLETESYTDQLLMALGALVYALVAYGLFRLGRWMRRKGKEPVASAPEPAPPLAEPEPPADAPVGREWIFLGAGVPQDWEKQPVSVFLWPHSDRIELLVCKGYDSGKEPERKSAKCEILPPDWLQWHDAHELSELIRQVAGVEIQPPVLVDLVPGLLLGTPIRTIPADKDFTDVLLYQGPLGQEQLGHQMLYLQLKQGGRWELYCVSHLNRESKAHHDYRDVTGAFAPGGNIRPVLDASRELTGVWLDPQEVRARIRREPLLSNWDPQKRSGTFPAAVPPLTKAVESGPIGTADRAMHRDPEGNVHITHTSGDSVKYYFFEDGTLALVGRGATRAVDHGGFDGRSYYEPEPSPFSERVLKQTRRVVAAQGVTSIGQGLLMGFEGIEELHLADSVREVCYNQMYSLTVLRAGEDLRSVNLFTGPLRELALPGGAVELVRHNSGTLLGIKTEDPQIRKVIDEKLELEFRTTIKATYRMYPGAAEKLANIVTYDPWYAAQTLAALKRNGRVIGVVELPGRLEGLCGIPLVPRKELELHFAWNYGEYLITYAAALAYAALSAKPMVIRCVLTRMRLWDEGMRNWWRAEFPETELILSKSE